MISTSNGDSRLRLVYLSLVIVSLFTISGCQWYRLRTVGDAPPVMPDGVDLHVVSADVSRRLKTRGTGPLSYRGGVAIQSRDPEFGKFSGIHVTDDGKQLVAIGPSGWLIAELEYDVAGNLSDLKIKQQLPLNDELGKPLQDKRQRDAESLYYDGEQYYVGFESNNRIWSYQSAGAAAQAIVVPDEVLVDVPECCGFSSLTGAGDDRLLALTEASSDEAGKVVHDKTKGWLWGEGTSGLIWLRASQDWLPVDLTSLSNGDLILIETAARKRGRTRISRIAQDEIEVKNVMQAEIISTIRPPDVFARMEAAHARQSADDRTLLYLMSDSNRNWPTLLLMFELTQ